MTFGIDVSHHQAARVVPWATIAQTATFCICRSGYGALLRDREVANHMKAARAHGLKVGLYHFFRSIHSVSSQLDLFRSVADQVGCQTGDIVPFVDIEKDPVPASGAEVEPAWSEPARQLVEAIASEVGGCGVYITQREFKMLGSPEWVLQRPIWCAHYTKGAPDTPANRPVHIHQHRVGLYDPNGPGGYYGSQGGLILDQNRALLPLPLIGEQPLPTGDAPELPPVTKPDGGWIGDPQLGLPDESYDELAEQRKRDNLENE